MERKKEESKEGEREEEIKRYKIEEVVKLSLEDVILYIEKNLKNSQRKY